VFRCWNRPRIFPSKDRSREKLQKKGVEKKPEAPIAREKKASGRTKLRFKLILLSSSTVLAVLVGGSGFRKDMEGGPLEEKGKLSFLERRGTGR